MKTLILLRGLPGAGKTEFAAWLDENVLHDEYNYFVAADDFMVDERGIYKFDSNKLEEVHIKCQDVVEREMINGCNPIIVHNTMTTEKEIEPYTYLANRYGYRLVSLIVENRHGGVNKHQVPESTITKMRNRFSIKL